ncbi:hypothetical protein F4861DRAFT_539324 [Xylaria intraflava]|nr:hypothetical protein F4861DRAFT_539324 [Xylaria intraflava]
MARWDPHSGTPAPSCNEASRPSVMCAHCRKVRRRCIAPAAGLRTRGVELAKLLREDPNSPVLANMQYIVKTLLQPSRVKKSPSRRQVAHQAVARQAAARQAAADLSNNENRIMNPQERQIAALESMTAAVNQLVEGQKKLIDVTTRLAAAAEEQALDIHTIAAACSR